MHKCIHFHPCNRSSPLCTSPTQHWRELREAQEVAECAHSSYCGVSYFTVRRARNPPKEVTYTCKKTVGDGQRGAKDRWGETEWPPDGPPTIPAVKTPGLVTRNLSGRLGIERSFHWGRIWINSVRVFSSKRADGPQLDPCMHLHNLVITSSYWRGCPWQINVSPYVAACTCASWCMPLWLRYVILCGPQLLCHTVVHDGSAR